MASAGIAKRNQCLHHSASRYESVCIPVGFEKGSRGCLRLWLLLRRRNDDGEHCDNGETTMASTYCPYRRKPANCVLWLIASTAMAPDPTICLPCWFGCPCERRPQVEETVHQTNKPIDLVAQSLCLLHRCHKRPPHIVALSLCLPVSSSRRLQSLCLRTRNGCQASAAYCGAEPLPFCGFKPLPA